MPTVSGRVLFDRTRTAAPPGTMAGIANVPVVLQHEGTGAMLAVYTNASGNFAFNNVKVVVEIDGNQHLEEKRKKNDIKKDKVIQNSG